MRWSDFSIKTLKSAPKDEESSNARLLVQGGFIAKLAAGVYTFLPLGLRVLDKIENIVRAEMNAAGGAELLMPALHPKENWRVTGRWESFDALFKLKSKSENEYALGPTHEEVIYPLLKHLVASYRDLPLYLYQLQTKFRDEPRAKSGLLRCREFRMKDLYSFHSSNQDRDQYYEVMRKSYLKIFKRLGLEVIETKASGGSFSELSQEFQVVAPAGEDTIYYCKRCRTGINKEVGGVREKCARCGGSITAAQAIEVGNIFPLKEKFAEDFSLTFKGKDGREELVKAGCYGLGTSRAMGTLVEVSHDEQGIIWPEGVAPFRVQLIGLKGRAEKLYNKFLNQGVEVLYDDRKEASAGEKFADADLIGLPWRAVVSEQTRDKIELKGRDEKEGKLVAFEKFIEKFKNHAG